MISAANAMQINSIGRNSVSTMVPPQDFVEERMTPVANPSELGMKLQQAISDKEKETGEKIILRQEETPEPVVQEQPVEKTIEPSVENKVKKTMIQSDASVKYRRLDGYAFKKYGSKNITNRSLDIFLNSYYRRRHIDEEFTICGVVDRNERNPMRESLWDEGGCYEANAAHALVVTDSHGAPVAPNFVYSNTEVVNGRHALVPVREGYYIICAGRERLDRFKEDKEQKSIIGVYKVISTEVDESFQPRFKTKLVAYQADGVWSKFDTEDTVWNEDSPAIKAVNARLNETNAISPCYIRRYRERKPNVDDFNNIIADEEFMSNIQEMNSLEEVYSKFDELFTPEHFVRTEKIEYPAMYVVVTLNPTEDGNEEVKAYFIGCTYSETDRTSVGKRYFICSLVLKDDEGFSYPDRYLETPMSVEDVKKNLHNSTSVVTFFRRISL